MADKGEHIDDLQLRWVQISKGFLTGGTPALSQNAKVHTLWTIMQGTATVMLHGQPIKLQPGICMLFEPETTIEVDKAGDGRLQYYSLEFEAASAGDAEDGRELLSFAAGRPCFIKPFAPLMDVLDSLFDLRAAVCGMARFKRNILLQEAIYLVAAAAADSKHLKEGEHVVTQTILYMKENYKAKMTLQELADFAGIGIRQYTHMFRQLTGTSPMDYLGKLRIERAKKLLLAPSNDMVTVASHVGFKDEFYFSRKFKQHVGISPRVYVQTREPRVIGLLYTSHLLALGHVPVGAPDYHLFENYYVREHVRAMTPFKWEPCDMEAVRAMKPDLILGYEHMRSEEQEQLSELAEVIAIDWHNQDVYGQLRQISAVVGKQRQEREWMERHLAKADQARLRIERQLGGTETCAVLVMERNTFRVVGSRNMGHVFFRLLGLNPHPLVKQHMEAGAPFIFSEPKPYDDLSKYDADRLILMINPKEQGAPEAFNQLKMSERWRNLAAVRGGRMHIVPFNKWWVYSPLAIDGQLDEAVAFLQKEDVS
ncbi:helix-turn-helix domain-containing protein [Paenibacillus sp. KS-LC4]|uniref:helix-turn-helix domain-containing protein n=1 Tax=Paenibacillus sp. KS-LC4 TaxID=2979727 RepID=UPI0030D4E27C